MARKVAWLIWGVILLLGLSTCSKRSTNSGGGLPTTYTTYSASVQPYWNALCGGVNCHLAAPFGNNLDLRAGNSWANLVGVNSLCTNGKKRVVANSIAESYLLDKLEADTAVCGDRMPRFATPLSATQINVIKAWINAGAPNN